MALDKLTVYQVVLVVALVMAGMVTAVLVGKLMMALLVTVVHVGYHGHSKAVN